MYIVPKCTRGKKTAINQAWKKESSVSIVPRWHDETHERALWEGYIRRKHLKIGFLPVKRRSPWRVKLRLMKRQLIWCDLFLLPCLSLHFCWSLELRIEVRPSIKKIFSPLINLHIKRFSILISYSPNFILFGDSNAIFPRGFFKLMAAFRGKKLII